MVVTKHFKWKQFDQIVKIRRHIFLTYCSRSIIVLVVSTGHEYDTGEEGGLKQRVRWMGFGEGGNCNHHHFC